MYNIGEKVVHVNGGVFIVDSERVMTIAGSDMKYLVLKPLYITQQNKTLTIYVPYDRADSFIRYTMPKDEAIRMLELLKSAEPIWVQESKLRKERFTELVKTGQKENICLVLKSLYVQQQKLYDDNKALNLLDYDFFNKLKNEVEEELSVSLGIPKEDVPGVIEKHMQ